MKYLLLLPSLVIFAIDLFASNYSCILAADKYEKIYNLPQYLLLSVSLTESGKRIESGEFVSWPWTINVKGKGKFFKTKNEAVSYVSNYTKKGRKNIDIGCMQINYMYHPQAFKNFQDAFDPYLNVEWSAKMLKTLYEKFGSWKEAVGYYHSYRNTRRKKYSAKVFNTLLTVKTDKNYTDIVQAAYKIEKENKKDIISNDNYSPLVKPVTSQNEIPEYNLTKKSKNKPKKVEPNSAYILARMEKVNFFRDYFYKKAKN